MDVLIIGGNRFVGRLLGFRLLAQGHAVTLLNRGHLPDPFGAAVERFVGDRRGPALEELLDRRTFDVVIDMAAYTGEDGRRMAELLRGRSTHYVMVSTGQVYLVREGCPRPARQPIEEAYFDGPVMARPGDPSDFADWEYGIGKRECEDAIATADFPATRIRIPMVNGVGDYARRIEGYLWRLVDGGPVLLVDGGEHRVRHVDAGEVARFVVDILGREVTFGRAFNLAQREMPTLRELVGMLAELLGSRAVIVGVARKALDDAGLRAVDVSPFDGRWMSCLDETRVREELGFCHAPLAHTLAAVVGSFLGHTPSDRPAGYAHRALERELAGA